MTAKEFHPQGFLCFDKKDKLCSKGKLAMSEELAIQTPCNN